MSEFNINQRVYELMEQYNRHDIKEQLEEYHKLVDTLIYLNETLREEEVIIQYWEKYSETLLLKFALHGLTVYDILQGHTLKSRYYEKELSGKSIIDAASAKVVLRSQLETFLMYHYIYVNPESDDEKQLRYHAWIYSSILSRQNFPFQSEYARQQREKDQKAMEDAKKEMQGLSSFQRLSEKQKKGLLDVGTGKLFNNWSTILKETGFSEKHALSVMYYHWSIYAHAEGLSAVQLTGSAFTVKKQGLDMLLDLQSSKFMICLMITALAQKYTVIQKRLTNLPDALRFDIQFYTAQARTVNFE